jgi:hypothetical protein
MLQMVTITGCDDSTDILEMIDVSVEYPFVEWGILIGSQFGTRFPSAGWIETLVKSVTAVSGKDGEPGINLSLHVCGEPLRSLQCGRFTDVLCAMHDVNAWGRVQLNFHADPAFSGGENTNVAKAGAKISDGIRRLCDAAPSHNLIEWIFQADGVNDGLHRDAVELEKRNCSILFDHSAGMGIAPDAWPEMQALQRTYPFVRVGYAGGLGPENIRDELPKILASAKVQPNGWWLSTWIDMETHIRSVKDSQSVVDLSKVREVLQACQPFIE